MELARGLDLNEWIHLDVMQILSVLVKYFLSQQRVVAWGKLSFVGRKRTIV